jgi:hypothetical protein
MASPLQDVFQGVSAKTGIGFEKFLFLAFLDSFSSFKPPLQTLLSQFSRLSP